MHRLLVETDQLSAESPALSKESLNHLKVLRLKDGEAVELFDGQGRARLFSSCGGALRPAETEVREAARPRHGLVLFACVTKGARWDWTIEKATELGATRIVPVVSARTIVRLAPGERESKCTRWRRIAEEAARQSDAMWVPEIALPVSFADSLALVRETRCFVGALTTPPPQMIGDALFSTANIQPSTFNSQPSTFSVYVGPEGDFTPDELAALVAIATPVSFGSTILRAETAAIYGLSVVKAFLDGRSCRLEV